MTTSATARAMADAASELIAGVDATDRATLCSTFPSDEERTRWFYTPTDHGGLTLHRLSPVQHRQVMRLVRAGLGRGGYVTVATIMGLENVLDELEGWTSRWEGPRGRDPLRYYVRIFGTPGSPQWGWRIGGHHVSLNFTIVNDEVVAASPLFFGADPASSPLTGGMLLRPLGACEDIARDLMDRLDASQHARAIVSGVPPVDLVGANRSALSEGDGPLRLARVWRNEFTGELLDLVERIQDDEESRISLTDAHVDALRYTARPKGLAASAMTDAQRDVLRTLVDAYVERLADDVAAAASERITGVFGDLHFAWAGSLERGRPHYYRIQGPRTLIEYDNTTRDANHVHTVWRDPVADFGRDALGAHRRTGH